MSDRIQNVLLLTTEDLQEALETTLSPAFTVKTKTPPANRATIVEADCIVTTELLTTTVDTPVVYCGDESVDSIGQSYRVDALIRPSQIEMAVEQVRVAVRNQRDEQSRIDRLHEAATELITAETHEEVYTRIGEVANRVLEFEDCYLGIVENEMFIPKFSVSKEVGPRPLKYGQLGETYRTKKSTLIHDLGAESSATPARQRYRSGISVPIGKYGVLQVIGAETHSFTQRDLELAELLATYAVGTLSRIESESELRESRRRTENLQEGATTLATVIEEQDAFETMVDIAERILSFDRCVVMDVDGEYLTPRAYSTNAQPDDAAPMHISEGLCGWCYRNSESRVVSDLATDTKSNPQKAEYRSGISIPIGEFGVFQAVSTDPDAFTDRDKELGELLASHVRETLDRILAEQKRNAERDRLATLFENIPDAGVAFEYRHGEPIIKRVNTAFERVFGYEETTVLGKSLDEFILPTDDPLKQAEADRLNRRLQAGDNVRVEVERIAADGSRYFLLHVVPLQLDAENVNGYAIYTDLTTQKEREQELTAQNKQLDEFASIVSHDLRNPINVASGYLELARETGEDAYLMQVSDAINRMDTLVGDLLLLARKGTEIQEQTTLDLFSIANQAWDNVDTKEAVLEIDETITLKADRGRLLELFENLFRNAIEHAGPTTKVTIGPIDNERGFYVADDGPGIGQESIERIFETGYTTMEDGTGLGLAITERIADAHGWDCTVHTGDVGGARFEFVTDVPASNGTEDTSSVTRTNR